MCGITGFTGSIPALPFLMQGLSKLEYRGYDSAGVTLVSDRRLLTYKAKGRLRALEELLDGKKLDMTTGIGHTRWATHGVPSNLNAHPHTNPDETIALVHNGIIENYSELRAGLMERGYVFRSQTDSEVIVMLLDEEVKKGGSFHKALLRTLRQLKGSYALCITTIKEPDTLYVAKKESPLVLSQSEEGVMVASDAPAVLEFSKEILSMEDGMTAVLRPKKIELFDASGHSIPLRFLKFPYDVQSAQKGGYDSFMLKEIHEEPHAVKETLRGRLTRDHIRLKELEECSIDFSRFKEVGFVACGTAYHACMYGELLMKRFSDAHSYSCTASEFRYGDPHCDAQTLCIFVSQSGETADTMAALKAAKARHATTIAITNVLGSSISRAADLVLYTAAGPEIAVASTKAYTTQLILLQLLVFALLEKMGRPVKGLRRRIAQWKKLPELLEEVLSKEKEIAVLATMFKNERDAYFIGRQLDYAGALEAALKLKEVSYIHADAYYAGELKHGPIALIEQDTIVVALASEKAVAGKTISNVKETLARGARAILVTDMDTEADGIEHVLRLPRTSEEDQPILFAVWMQLLAYYAAVEKGCDVDKPRNLAKSVTVE